MKYLGLILVLALVAGQVFASRINENDSPPEHSRVRRSYNDKFRNFLEKFKDTLREGNDTLGIPIMDPFYSEEIKYVLEEKQVNGTVQLRDFSVVGLAGYLVDKAEIAILSMKITIGLTWPQIYSEGFYKFDAVVTPDKIDAFGNGNFTLRLNDLSVGAVIKMGLSDGVKVKNIATTIKLGALELKVTGLLGDEDSSDMISAALSDMAPQLVNDFQVELTDIANEKLTKIINEKLEGKSLTDILGMIG